jgi:hypothetical protein
MTGRINTAEPSPSLQRLSAGRTCITVNGSRVLPIDTHLNAEFICPLHKCICMVGANQLFCLCGFNQGRVFVVDMANDCSWQQLPVCRVRFAGSYRTPSTASLLPEVH